VALTGACRDAQGFCGVFNVVNGDKTALDAILQHSGIAAVSFYGPDGAARLLGIKPTTLVSRRKALGLTSETCSSPLTSTPSRTSRATGSCRRRIPTWHHSRPLSSGNEQTERAAALLGPAEAHPEEAC
jgi:hypothetical protein